MAANATHGLRRTNADKRKAVMTLLSDLEWGAKSNRWIAEACCVGNKFVGDVRRDLEASPAARSTVSEHSHTERQGRDGREIDTANIGRRRQPEPEPELPVEDDAAVARSRENGREVVTAAQRPRLTPGHWRRNDLEFSKSTCPAERR